MILLFARSPVAGAVKTRLASAIGDEGCARLQARLIAHSVGLLQDAGLPFELWLDGPESELRRRLPDFNDSIVVRPQAGRDLGARMQAALKSALEREPAAIVIGSDCPELTPPILREAFDALQRCDVVLAPAVDGGYALVGSCRSVPSIFDDISWGSERVLAQTRQRIAARGLACIELATLRDLDRPEDLEFFARNIPWLKDFSINQTY